MDLIVKLLGGAGVTIPCGINPYLPLLILSVGAKGNRIKLNPDFAFLGEWPVLIVLAVLVGLDIFADKLPQIENLYRFVNLVVCPVAGGIAMAATIPSATLPSAVSFMLGVVLAELMYLVKSGWRAGLIATSNLARTFEAMISLGEDVVVAVLVILALAVPVVGGPVGLVVLGLSFWWMNNLKRRKQTAKI